jgi:glycyl-tRNA synthetase alpha chain
VREPDTGREVRYGDIFMQNEVEQSRYNFQHSDPATLFALFEKYEGECARLCDAGEIEAGVSLVLPAYDYCVLSSHAFNLLDARGAISVTERQRYILRIRTLARRCAEAFLRERRRLGYPLLGEHGRAVADEERRALDAAAAADEQKAKERARKGGGKKKAKGDDAAAREDA